MNKLICKITGLFENKNEYNDIRYIVDSNNNYVICDDYFINEDKIDLYVICISDLIIHDYTEIHKFLENFEDDSYCSIIYKMGHDNYFNQDIFVELENTLKSNGIVYVTNEDDFKKELDNFIKTKSAIDSTKRHINKVSSLCGTIAMDIIKRGQNHDKSKFYSPEWQYFREHDYELKNLEYGKQSYFDSIEKLKPAIEHHRSINSHHPEYYENGINDMDLVDLVEMICDWKAATERCLDGNIYESLLINKEKYGIDDQLYNILLNTVKRKLGENKDEN